MWLSGFVLNSCTQGDSAEDMDSTESPRQQTEAHVSYGQYSFIVCSYFVFLTSEISICFVF